MPLCFLYMYCQAAIVSIIVFTTVTQQLIGVLGMCGFGGMGFQQNNMLLSSQAVIYAKHTFPSFLEAHFMQNIHDAFAVCAFKDGSRRIPHYAGFHQSSVCLLASFARPIYNISCSPRVCFLPYSPSITCLTHLESASRLFSS